MAIECTPGFTPDPSLYPFESRWFDSADGRMHYVDEGSGTPILFCHGNPTWSFLYRRIIAQLRDRFRCIAVDNLGFGLSERPHGFGYTLDEHAHATGAFVDHLGLDGFITMGQDWGGPISLAVATARVERMRGVVLGNTWFWPADEPTAKVFSKLMSTRLVQRQILERHRFIERTVALGVSRKLSASEMRHYTGVQASPEARVGAAALPKQIQAARPTLERLANDVPATLGSKPALFVWGMKDFVFPPGRTLPRMQSTFPDHITVELPGAHHFVQEDAPNEIAAAIAARFG